MLKKIMEKTEPLVLNNAHQAEAVAPIKNNFAANLYTICNLDIVRSTSSDDFLQYSNTQKIKDQIKQVLDIEAPIMRTLLVKRFCLPGVFQNSVPVSMRNLKSC